MTVSIREGDLAALNLFLYRNWEPVDFATDFGASPVVKVTAYPFQIIDRTAAIPLISFVGVKPGEAGYRAQRSDTHAPLAAGRYGIVAEVRGYLASAVGPGNLDVVGAFVLQAEDPLPSTLSPGDRITITPVPSGTPLRCIILSIDGQNLTVDTDVSGYASVPNTWTVEPLALAFWPASGSEQLIVGEAL